jgi:LmbE family N-acetylglucosaminyl deacetylase
MENVLAVIAHPDDLEIMAGGSLLKWKKEGKNIHVLILTDGAWKGADNTWIRNKEQAKLELIDVSHYIQYNSLESLDIPCLTLRFEDSIVCEVLNRISKYRIDTILTSWEYDTNHDHEITARIVHSASRRVDTILMGQINYYANKFFTPNVFVDITKEWNEKLNLVSLYESQWIRNQKDWTEFMDITSKYYGKIVSVERAEGFISNRILI